MMRVMMINVRVSRLSVEGLTALGVVNGYVLRAGENLLIVVLAGRGGVSTTNKRKKQKKKKKRGRSYVQHCSFGRLGQRPQWLGARQIPQLLFPPAVAS